MADMKILIVNNYYPEHIGGIEYVAHNLVIEYRKCGHQVRWIASDVNDTPHSCHVDDRPLAASNFTEQKLGFPYPIPQPYSFKTIFDQVKWCDVIHLHDCLYLSNIITFLASRWLHKPVLITQHVKAVPYKQATKKILQSIAYNSIGKWLLTAAEQVIFCSLTVQNWFKQFIKFQNSPWFIPNGVDTNLFHCDLPALRTKTRLALNLNPDKPMFLFAGRFVEKKGIHLLRPIIEQNKDWNWVLIGRPDDQNPHDWLNSNNLVILPPQPQKELQKYYAAADLLVLPSIGEGFPLAVQESMACGTPTLLTEESLKAIPRGHDLFFITSPDSPQIHQQLESFMSGGHYLQRLRDQVRQFACDEWSWHVASQQYQNLLSDLLIRA